jgi:hypothetical protein
MARNIPIRFPDCSAHGESLCRHKCPVCQCSMKFSYNVCLCELVPRFNSLTPQLNPSWQRSLPRFFTGSLIFKGLTARRLCKSLVVKVLIILNKEIRLQYFHLELTRRQNTRFIAYGRPSSLVEQTNIILCYMFKSICVYIRAHLNSSVI